ncbi:uncharacterized protein EV420DRAFT_268163 [Desarmillaria tabescens]|uniref:WD40 repeat-like protein n=1 Tax=Armillaria tabescens TaxID=1929756 RepID=A0AA39KE75_ARMTA|nr:uncharacterized protein EV420DRAFT_268163 [Desarmillaria tabescens]KAK0459460.1 hypothetical protein EV420DRAFT_268163 [Desarmillaria tabescens]
MDYNHQTIIYVLTACKNDDAGDLVAIGGEHSVQVLLVKETGCESLAAFHIGSRITAIAWSPKTVSPSSSDNWVIELAAAGVDYGLHLLTKLPKDEENIFHFGGGLSGHHGKVNDMCFGGGRGSDASRYIATVSGNPFDSSVYFLPLTLCPDDKMLMVWNLLPSVDTASMLVSPVAHSGTASPPPRAQPTAYVIAFPHSLTSINSHPSTSKEFLVSDCKGSLFLTDWRSDPDDPDQDSWHNSSLVELVEPHALSEASLGRSLQWSGSVAWQRDSANIVGAVYGSKFSIWDLSKLQGGKPLTAGNSFPEGGDKFRWCYTYPDYFAISTQSPSKGALIHVHNLSYVHAQPEIFTVASRPHLVRDFDFLGLRGIPRLAVAVARTVVIFPIGVEP